MKPEDPQEKVAKADEGPSSFAAQNSRVSQSMGVKKGSAQGLPMIFREIPDPFYFQCPTCKSTAETVEQDGGEQSARSRARVHFSSTKFLANLSNTCMIENRVKWSLMREHVSSGTQTTMHYC
jgi:hypothetical protein